MLTSVRASKATLTSPVNTIDIGSCKLDAVKTMEVLLRYWPLSHSVRELVRMRAIAEWGSMELPLLDVGCGNGLFWEAIVNGIGEGADLSGILGVDLDPTEISVASARLSTHGANLHVADITATADLPELFRMHRQFRTVFANCSLEHVPKLDTALKNIRSFLHPEGRFILAVPAPRWTDTLSVKRTLRRFSPRLAGSFAGALDGFFQHHHLYPSYVWRNLLEGCGFTDVEMIGIGNQTSNRLYETWLPSALTGFISRCFLGRYPKYMSWLKMAYFSKQTRFIEEVHSGQSFTYDLESPYIEEFAISCRPALVAPKWPERAQ